MIGILFAYPIHIAMKHLLTISILSSFFLFCTPLTGIDDVINSLKHGDLAELSGHLDESIQLSILEKSGSFSKGQAQMVLRDFFQSHPIRGYEIISKETAAGREQCTGFLLTSAGSFRTLIFMKYQSRRSLIKEIRIEKI